MRRDVPLALVRRLARVPREEQPTTVPRPHGVPGNVRHFARVPDLRVEDWLAG